jgi:hypothetical protein
MHMSFGTKWNVRDEVLTCFCMSFEPLNAHRFFYNALSELLEWIDDFTLRGYSKTVKQFKPRLSQ